MKKAFPLILGVIALAAIGGVGYYLYSKSQEEVPEEQTEDTTTEDTSQEDTQDVSEETPSEKTNKILLVLGKNDYNDTEYEDTRAELERAGYKVIVASEGVSVSYGMEDGEAQVDKDLSEVQVNNYDAIVFIGGGGAHDYFNDNTALDLAKDFHDAGKVTAAICSAPTILANAGLLEGKKATCYPGYEDGLTSKGATYTAEAVTVDGLIITGNGPDAATEFGRKIAELLEAN